MQNKKIGILGGGQLGKMMCLAAANWDLVTYILDAADCPARHYCYHHEIGNYKNYDDVLRFGRMVDVLTIEIEHVNIDALKALAAEGTTKIHVAPPLLELIQDKGLQKIFYQENSLASADFSLFETPKDIKKDFPFVWKSRKGGYDGKGVAVVRNAEDLKNLPNVPCLVENLVPIEKEIAVIAAQNTKGEIVTYDSVEMEFNPKANLLDTQICPSRISPELEQQARQLAHDLIKKLGVVGLLAVEMFVTKEGEILINEVAPRPHNSGHHTIEAAETSQFEQHIRAVMGLPLGSTAMRNNSLLINLLGAEGHSGEVVYQGMEACLAVDGFHPHLYGKITTKPFRKMGHATIMDKDLTSAAQKAEFIRETLQIVAKK